MTDNPPPPFVSVILPTLNAESLLDQCLRALTAQSYPRDRFEIVIADAHSRDRTREIARRYGAVILDDDGRDMEQGKRLALQHARGDFILFLDADNELTHEDFLERAVAALQAHPHALGLESYYLASPKMSSFCAYLTQALHISDPLSWILTRNPVCLESRDGVERWTLPGSSAAYPLGANGFVFRRADLESVRATEQFQDTHIALALMLSGRREWLRLAGRGVHHYYVQTLWGFVKKRRRAIAHYMNVRDESPASWLNEKPPVPVWLGALYCLSVLGPLVHALRGWRRDQDSRWMWHVLACPASFLGTAWGVWTQRTSRNRDRLVPDLQVDQSLPPDSSRPRS